MQRERPWTQLWVGPALIVFGAAMMLFGAVWTTSDRTWRRDRWRRADLTERFPAGEASQPLLLTNAGEGPAFAEIRCAAWTEPRAELLLPGESQMVELPQSAGQPAQVRYFALDLQKPQVVPLPADWFHTSVDVDEAGRITSGSRKGGDSSPRRGLVGVDSIYPLPIRVELPFEPHWRLTGETAERRAWIGPGTRDASDQCAYEIGPPVSVTVRVPRRTQTDAIEIGGGDGPTRLALQPDGTVQREALPAWRRIALAASF